MSTLAKRESWKQKDHKTALIIFCVIFSIYAFTLLYPVFWILVKSFTSPTSFNFNNGRFFPEKLYFGNYSEMVKSFDFLPMIGNTIILSLIIPTVQICSCCCISYAYAKFKFKGKGVVYLIAIASMFIPNSGTLAASFELMLGLGLMDTIPGYILMCGGGMGFSFLLISSQYASVSKEYTEAAEIDGASRLRVFVQIITPLISATIIALWVLSFISTWNDYMTPYLFLGSHKTLSVGIKELYVIAAQQAKYPVLFAGIIMVEIPVIAVFFAFQKKILSFSLGGGIKG